MKIYLHEEGVLSTWFISKNPYGDGLILVIPRGIPCENHSQVLSFHTSNTPDEDSIKQSINELRYEILKKLYSVDLNEIGDFAVVFLYQILGQIAKRAETIYVEKFYNELKERDKYV